MAEPMERADRIGYWVSGVAHASLLGAALVGGALFRPQPLEAVRMAEVATMTDAEFQSLAAAAAGHGPVSDTASTTPAQPRAPADENRPGAVEAVSPPSPDGQAADLATPSDRPEARPDLSDFQGVTARPVAAATDAPQPAQPDNAVELAALPQPADRPDPVRNPAQSPAPIPQRSAQAPVESSRPRGRPEGLAEAVQARRASAEAARQREALLAREAEEAAAEQAAAKRAQQDAARRAAEERARNERREAEAREAEADAARKASQARERARREAEAKAEAEAAEQKVAAAEKAAEQKAAERKAEAARRAAAEKAAEQEAAEKAEKAAAEKKAAEAKARKAAEEKAAAEKAAAAKAAAEAAAAAKAKEKAEAERKAAEAAKKALAEAQKKDEGSAGSGGGGAAASGPPLSQGEKDGFRVAVEQCWNRGSLSTEASRTTVSVQFSMAPDGTVEKGSLRMIGHDGGSDAAAKQAYEAARRAILMCEKGGYKLPPEKYNRWKDVIIDFNASGGARVK
ncbi:protein TolA [Paracoccus sp. N5]|uniref:protein TolA n=1 Tax=Paracoccus sp. N5 TaxID=1101189 RepID=UPI001E513AAB|nr:protein TolA [Paracoccus sp. N5]